MSFARKRLQALAAALMGSALLMGLTVTVHRVLMKLANGAPLSWVDIGTRTVVGTSIMMIPVLLLWLVGSRYRSVLRSAYGIRESTIERSFVLRAEVTARGVEIDAVLEDCRAFVEAAFSAEISRSESPAIEGVVREPLLPILPCLSFCVDVLDERLGEFEVVVTEPAWLANLGIDQLAYVLIVSLATQIDRSDGSMGVEEIRRGAFPAVAKRARRRLARHREKVMA